MSYRFLLKLNAVLWSKPSFDLQVFLEYFLYFFLNPVANMAANLYIKNSLWPGGALNFFFFLGEYICASRVLKKLIK